MQIKEIEKKVYKLEHIESSRIYHYLILFEFLLNYIKIIFDFIGLPIKSGLNELSSRTSGGNIFQLIYFVY